MADITMCYATTCPKELKEICYRYTAKMSEYRQSMFDASASVVMRHGNYECTEFVLNTEKSNGN